MLGSLKVVLWAEISEESHRDLALSCFLWQESRNIWHLMAKPEAMRIVFLCFDLWPQVGPLWAFQTFLFCWKRSLSNRFHHMLYLRLTIYIYIYKYRFVQLEHLKVFYSHVQWGFQHVKGHLESEWNSLGSVSPPWPSTFPPEGGTTQRFGTCPSCCGATPTTEGAPAGRLKLRKTIWWMWAQYGFLKNESQNRRTFVCKVLGKGCLLLLHFLKYHWVYHQIFVP